MTEQRFCSLILSLLDGSESIQIEVDRLILIGNMPAYIVEAESHTSFYSSDIRVAMDRFCALMGLPREKIAPVSGMSLLNILSELLSEGSDLMDSVLEIRIREDFLIGSIPKRHGVERFSLGALKTNNLSEVIDALSVLDILCPT